VTGGKEDRVRNYDRINAPPPDEIENKRAHIVGGGIGGLAAAAFLVSDAHMPAENVTVYESLAAAGGARYAAGDHRDGYTSRGGRQLEARMECLWYLCSKVPSLQTSGRTVLDETHQANDEEPVYSSYRLMERQGERHLTTGAFMSPADGQRMLELLMTPDEQLEGLTTLDWFSPEFTDSVFWLSWSSELAFRDYHSPIDIKRSLARFVKYVGGRQPGRGILHTQYNEFDSIIRPLQVWLDGQGVRFRTATHVRDIETEDQDEATVAAALVFDDAAGRHRIPLIQDDLVFFTNGSLTQNATRGGTHTVAALDRDTSDRGCFTVWEQLAGRDHKFGRPAAFISDVDRSNFYTFVATITGDPTLFDYMQAKTGSVAPTGGAISIVDSSWKLTLFLYGKYFPDQPGDVNVLQAYGQVSDTPGDYVNKPMQECTGAEMLAELLYHCGLQDNIDQILAHAAVTTTAMPYSTSEFMPRRIADRPKVIPDGCVNLAFVGQFVELPGDVVFTVETSVRTAMIAVWGLTGIDKPMIPSCEPLYDIRVLADILKVATGSETLKLETLASTAAGPSHEQFDELLGRIPEPAI
jgi:oleate hydratase